MKYLRIFDTHSEYVEYTQSSEFVVPNISGCRQEQEAHFHDIGEDGKYFRTEALSSGDISFTIPSGVSTSYLASISYSKDNGKTWVTSENINNEEVVVTVPVENGDYVCWKGNGKATAAAWNTRSTFSSTCNMNIGGNVMSLLYGNEFQGQKTLVENYSFLGLCVGCTNLISVENVVLPATTLTNNCYEYMFSGCTSLTTPMKELPSETAKNLVYYQMFAQCTSLTSTPSISVTSTYKESFEQMFMGCTSLTDASNITIDGTHTGGNNCKQMFYGCTSLVKVPNLPATTLAESCYSEMFYECTSLITAPSLPATTLANGCYSKMFAVCKSLTTAPQITATTLGNTSCQQMFSGCTALTNVSMTIGREDIPMAASACTNMFRGCKSLVTVPSLPATTLANNCYSSMFQECSNLSTAPLLPATTLAIDCYNTMFRACKKLTNVGDNYLPSTTLAIGCYYGMFRESGLVKSPILPTATLVEKCYQEMFMSSKVTHITCYATDISATNCTKDWTYGVPNSGTFVKKTGMVDWASGRNGIPTGWTVEEYSDVHATGVTLDTTATTITKGSTTALTATVTPNDAYDKSVTWSTSNSSVATVNSNGLVTAVGCGNATITVTTTDGGYTAQCTTSVENPVTGVSLNNNLIYILTGATYQLEATTVPSDACGDTSVSWTTSDSSIATVSNNGLVSAIGIGSAVITVTTTVGSYTATCAVEVSEPVAVTGVTLDKNTLDIVVGATDTLVATVLPNNATDKGVTWSSSNNSIATVSSGGVVTAVSTGSTTITVTTDDGSYTASCSVTITEPTFTSMIIEGLATISAETCGYNAICDNIEDVTTSATWSITSGSQYATINSSNGTLTILNGANESTVTIQAVYLNLTATKTLTLTYVSGSTAETETESATDIGGNTTTVTTTVVTNEDGSSYEAVETVVTDVNGDLIGTTETTKSTNADGSYEGVTTNYDENGNPTDGSNVTGDTDGNVSTQSVEYDESGNTVVTGYEIDTTASDSGKTFNADGVNTDYYAFDLTHGFILDIDFTIDFANQPANQNGTHHNILTAKRADPSPYYGFQLRHLGTEKKIQLGTQFESGGNTSTQINPYELTGTTARYVLQIIYNPTLTANTFICKDMLSSTDVFVSDYTFPDLEALKYLKVTIGYAMNSSGNPFRYSNINVSNFSLRKLKNVANPTISCVENAVTISCDTANADIYYRLNLSGEYSAYTAPISITADTVIQAYAIANGDTSDIVREDCTFVVANPVIACDGENVTITCATVGADIYYRLNESGNYSAYTASIPITADTVVEAYGEINGTTSETVKQTCIYTDIVYEPVITCTNNVVSITCATHGATIYYRLNESGSYSAYTASFNIYEDTVVEAYGELNSKTSTTAKTSCVADYSKMYFTIESLADSNEIKMQRNKSPNNPVLEYSLDSGQTWTSITVDGTKTFATINNGETILFKGNNSKLSSAWDIYNRFNGSKNFKVYGNAMSLLNGDNFVNNSEFATGSTCNLCGLFYGTTTITDASNLILPATTLMESSYNGMFRGCSNLQYGPKLLPALVVSKDGYSSMFEGCVKLVEAPEIMATTVSGDTALNRMFCANRTGKVTTAPMTKGPVLRITNPNAYANCYQQLFCGQGNLVEVTILAQGTNLSFANWLNYTNSGGVIKKLSATTLTSGNSGVPTGWTTEDITE